MLPQVFLEKLKSIKSKRPRTIIDHILKFGYITSQEIRELYGYNHPPRAIRDVREHGIPIITYSVDGKDGRKIAAYKFGNIQNAIAQIDRKSGRTILSKTIKDELIKKFGAKCFIYLEDVEETQLQIDHRIPYEISGEATSEDINNFMLLCPSANRLKSWSCEHCKNWQEKEKDLCKKCFWAFPENYEHIAGKKIKTIILNFNENEIDEYDQFVETAAPQSPQEAIKKLIRQFLSKSGRDARE